MKDFLKKIGHDKLVAYELVYDGEPAGYPIHKEPDKIDDYVKELNNRPDNKVKITYRAFEENLNEDVSNWEQYYGDSVLVNRYIKLVTPIDIEGADLDLIALIYQNKKDEFKFSYKLFVDTGADTTLISEISSDYLSEIIDLCLGAIKEFDEKNDTDIIYNVKPLEPSKSDMAFLQESISESKINEAWKSFKTFRYRGMVNPKTGEIIYSVLSPKYKNVLSADLRANINDTEDFNNRDIINVAKQVLAKNESKMNEISDKTAFKANKQRAKNWRDSGYARGKELAKLNKSDKLMDKRTARKGVSTEQAIDNLVNIGFDKLSAYKPHVAKSAKGVMNRAVDKGLAVPHDFGRGKGKYRTNLHQDDVALGLIDDEETRNIANRYLKKQQRNENINIKESKINEGLSQKEYEKIARKFRCPKSPKAAAEKCIAFLRYVQRSGLEDELLGSRIFDSYGENGEAIANACFNAIIKECENDNNFKFFVTVLARRYMPVEAVLNKLEETRNIANRYLNKQQRNENMNIKEAIMKSNEVLKNESREDRTDHYGEVSLVGLGLDELTDTFNDLIATNRVNNELMDYLVDNSSYYHIKEEQIVDALKDFMIDMIMHEYNEAEIMDYLVDHGYAEDIMNNESLDEISDELANKVAKKRQNNFKKAERNFDRAVKKAWRDTENLSWEERKKAIFAKTDRTDRKYTDAGLKLANNKFLNRIRNKRKGVNEDTMYDSKYDKGVYLRGNEFTEYLVYDRSEGITRYFTDKQRALNYYNRKKKHFPNLHIAQINNTFDDNRGWVDSKPIDLK